MFNIKIKKTISCLLLLAFSATTFLSDTGLSDTLGIWSFKEQPAYCQMLADMYVRNRLIWVANSLRYQELLLRHNSQALLLPSGRYLMSPETKNNPLALIRAVAHEDFEILWQKEERAYPERYAALKAKILAQKDILGAYLALPSQPKLNPNDRILFNDLMSTAFELHFILQEKVIKRESLTSEESAFSAIMEPVIRELQVKDPAGNYTGLSEIFFDKEARLAFIFNVQKAKKTRSEKFMRVAKEATDRKLIGWYERLGGVIQKYVNDHKGQRPSQIEVAQILGVQQGTVSKYANRIRMSGLKDIDLDRIRMRGPIPKKRKTYVSDEEFVRVRSDFIEKNGRLPSVRELEGLLNITKNPVSRRLKKLGLLPFYSPRKGKNILEKDIIAAFEEYKIRHGGIAPEQADLVRMFGCSTVNICEKLLRINIGNLSNAKPFLLTRNSRRFAPKEADGASRIDPAAASFENIKDAADHIINRVDIVLKDESELERLAGFRYTNSVRLVRDSLEAVRNALIRFVKEGNIYSITNTISERVTFKFGYCSGDRLYIYEGLIDPKSPEYRQEDILACILLQILLKSLFTNDRFIDQIQDSLSLKHKNVVKRRPGTRSEYLGFLGGGEIAMLWDRLTGFLDTARPKAVPAIDDKSLNGELDRMYLEHFKLDNFKTAHPIFLLMQKLKRDVWIIKHIIAAAIHTVTWIVNNIRSDEANNASGAPTVQAVESDDVTQSPIYKDLSSHTVNQRDIDDLLNDIAKNRSKASNVLSYIMAHADEFDKGCLVAWCKGLIKSAFGKVLEEYVNGKTRLSGMNIIESDLVLRKLWLELCFMQVLPDENLLERFYSFAGYNRLASSREEYWDLIAQSDYQFAGKESVAQIKRIIKNTITGPSLDLMAGRSIYYRPDVALDVSDNFLKRNHARRKVVFDVSHLDKDRRLPFEDGVFKTVTIFYGINYIHDLDRLVKEVNRILGPEGSFIVASNEGSGIGAIKEASVTLGTIANYVKDNGFAIRQIEHLYGDGGETGYVLFMRKKEVAAPKPAAVAGRASGGVVFDDVPKILKGLLTERQDLAKLPLAELVRHPDLVNGLLEFVPEEQRLAIVKEALRTTIREAAFQVKLRKWRASLKSALEEEGSLDENGKIKSIEALLGISYKFFIKYNEKYRTHYMLVSCYEALRKKVIEYPKCAECCHVILREEGFIPDDIWDKYIAHHSKEEPFWKPWEANLKEVLTSLGALNEEGKIKDLKAFLKINYKSLTTKNGRYAPYSLYQVYQKLTFRGNVKLPEGVVLTQYMLRDMGMVSDSLWQDYLEYLKGPKPFPDEKTKKHYRSLVRVKLKEAGLLNEEGNIEDLNTVLLITSYFFKSRGRYIPVKTVYDSYEKANGLGRTKPPENALLHHFILRDLGFIKDHLWREYLAYMEDNFGEESIRGRRSGIISEELQKAGKLDEIGKIKDLETLLNIPMDFFISRSGAGDLRGLYATYRMQVSKGIIKISRGSYIHHSILRDYGFVGDKVWREYLKYQNSPKPFPLEKHKKRWKTIIRQLLRDSDKLDKGGKIKSLSALLSITVATFLQNTKAISILQRRIILNKEGRLLVPKNVYIHHFLLRELGLITDEVWTAYLKYRLAENEFPAPSRKRRWTMRIKKALSVEGKLDAKGKIKDFETLLGIKSAYFETANNINTPYQQYMIAKRKGRFKLDKGLSIYHFIFLDLGFVTAEVWNMYEEHCLAPDVFKRQQAALTLLEKVDEPITIDKIYCALSDKEGFSGLDYAAFREEILGIPSLAKHRNMVKEEPIFDA
ncbi:MAG: methyltransferase domain-containing protein, partial [Candidatus Omnitrophica bacterium]|nr:methyltransferase domain-containing protein [Candidatus Omnitrophota bacterium]